MAERPSGGPTDARQPAEQKGALSLQIEELFQRALGLEPTARGRLLEDIGRTDPALRDDLVSLISMAESNSGFLETPAFEEHADLVHPTPVPEGVSASPPPAAGLSNSVSSAHDADDDASPPELGAGTQIGPYKLLKRVGHGGMGEVYRAEQRHPVYRVVAIKVLKLGMDSRQVVGRFEQERQALAMMDHPNIASVFEAGTTSAGRLYFVMEYVSGVPVTKYCTIHELDLPARLRLFREICRAVQHAHQKGIVHRDLKPSNILISDSAEPAPKIIDFGVAKALHRPLTDKTLFTEHGIRIGTPAYMSPEQADPSRDVDTRADIYSLGVVLYELATGRLPFDLDTRRVTFFDLYRSANHELPRTPSRNVAEDTPASLRRQITGDLDAIVLKTLERDRDRRYASASELAADIDRFLSGEPVLARAPSATYRLRKLVAKNRAVVAAVTIAFIAVCIGFLVSTQLWLQARSARELATTQRDEILTYSDRFLLDQTIAEADLLWPAAPPTIPAMEAWLEGTSKELIERLPGHRAVLAALEDDLAALERNPSTTTNDRTSIADLETRHQHLSALVDALTRLSDPDPEIGTIADVRERLKFARTVRQRTLEEPAELWASAIASIADSTECPAYEGLQLPPQLGLIPLGRDPGSGLWEFAHLQSGTPPRRDDGDRLILEEQSSIVLVLLPGGTYLMGNQRTRSPSDPPGTITNIDPLCRSNEGPVHSITLEPFFLSKYEITQAQWIRLTRRNPSRQPAGAIWGDKVHTHLHPVEQVNWKLASTWTERVQLTLPTEAQWEYAARAGTHTPWWTGAEEASLAGSSNIQDLFANRHGRFRERDHVPWDDGYADTSPVGRYRANAFGLHDMMGNTWEWCIDRYGAYDLPVRAGDGLRLGTTYLERIIRGGAYDRVPEDARVGRREHLHEGKEVDVGVRPSRPIVY